MRLMTHDSDHKKLSHAEALIACIAIVSGTVLLLSAIDLVLPSVPDMPEIFDTSIASAQMVIAAFVAGSTIGMLIFGSLSEHFGRRKLFILSLVLFTIISYAATFSPNIWVLVGMRFLQGAVSSGTAVLAPGLIRGLFSELGAMRALSAMGSIEALVPGLAPLAGVWLHSQYGWTASFTVTSLLVAGILILLFIRPSLIPSIGTKAPVKGEGYLTLLKNGLFLRYGLGYALVLGGLLCFVFSTPAIIVETMDGTVGDFIAMQMVGVTSFIIFANLSGNLIKRWGAEPIVMLGTIVAVLGGLTLLTYALIGPNDATHLAYMFWILNTGLGLRGGASFVQALAASNGNDDRASAVILVSVSLFAAGGTAIIAPFIQYGLLPLTALVCLILVPALVLMLTIKPMKSSAGE